MEHSVKKIAKNRAELSDLRKDKKRFSETGFFEFAKQNKKKYQLSEYGDDLIATTWFTNDLIEDYLKTL
jgi:hypothetical protein